MNRILLKVGYLSYPYTKAFLSFSNFGYVARIMNRTVMLNLISLRKSMYYLYRHLSELYRVRCFLLANDSNGVWIPKFLLGACLITSMQDTISEDEMLMTAESFNVSKERIINKQTSEIFRDLEGDNGEALCIAKQSDHFEAPLTIYVRNLRKNINEWCKVISNRLLNIEITATSYQEEADTPRSYITRKFNLLNVVGDLFLDGRNFIDESWELLIDRPNFRIWRKPVFMTLKDNKSSLDKNVGKFNAYKYRICGSISDVSARCFLEVQLNLAYRIHWDKKVVCLESLRSRPDTDSDVGHTEIIRWVSKFPFPMANREYIYARRCWIDVSKNSVNSSSNDNIMALIISRSSKTFATYNNDFVCSMSSSERPNTLNSTSKYPSVALSSSWTSKFCSALVRVSQYESNLLIRSHANFDENGFDYYLTYYDDPQLVISKSTGDWLSSTVIPRLVDQLHKAALAINESGLPDGIPAIVSEHFLKSHYTSSVDHSHSQCFSSSKSVKDVSIQNEIDKSLSFIDDSFAESKTTSSFLFSS